MVTHFTWRRYYAARWRHLYSLTTQTTPQAFEAALPEPAPLHILSRLADQAQNKRVLTHLEKAALAAAAVAATFSTQFQSTFCEAAANSPRPPSSGSGDSEGDDNTPIDAHAVRQAMQNLWLRLDEQIHRLDASQPYGKTLPRMSPPEINFSNGSVTVIFKVPQQMNISGAAAEARRRLAAPPRSLKGGFSSASTTETSSSGPQGAARRLRRSSQNPADSLTIDVLEPYNAEEPAIFEFHGACTRENLNMVEAVMQQAVQPRSAGLVDPRRQGSAGPQGFPRWFGNLGDDELEAGLNQFFEPLRELAQEFERLHGEHQHGWGGMFQGEGTEGDDGGRDTWPTPLRRPPKRFDEYAPEEHRTQSYQTLQSRKADAAIKKLRDMGCQVFLPHTPTISTADAEQPHQPNADSTPKLETSVTLNKEATSVDWGQLAGYEAQKQAIEDCLLLPLVRPDIYDNVARGTREKFATNRPRAVLFVGPPGTGKTTSARVIATQAAVPLVYIPLEALASKWYGESEKSLASALEAADSLPDGCIVFLDELDALATSRAGELHEATRRLLGVLLRHMDGFDASKRSVVVGATNRPQDLDPALVSRFSATVEFGLPGDQCRKAILKQYAHHLEETELGVLAAATPGMAGRDLRDVCEQAERKWAARIVRGQAPEGGLPPLNEYLEAANARLREMGNAFGALKLKPIA